MARVSVARGLTGAPPQAAQFVGAPDQEGEDGDEGDHVEGQGSGAEEALQGWHVDKGRREDEFKGDAGEEQRVGEEADGAQ